MSSAGERRGRFKGCVVEIVSERPYGYLIRIPEDSDAVAVDCANGRGCVTKQHAKRVKKDEVTLFTPAED